MLSGHFMILRQVLFLLLPAAGFGGWLWLLAGRPPLFRRQAWLWLGLAGFAAHALLLQTLVYAGLPLRLTAWPMLLAGAAGLVPVWRAWKTQPGRNGVGFYALIFAVGFLAQAPGLLSLGPERYYGNGHYDQANYVVTAEFLTGEKFSTTPDEVGYRPWLFRALDAKEQRMTQFVVLGASAVTSGADSQGAYGALSIFLIALVGVATAAWLRSAALPRWAAAGAGLGAALSPALTQIHLDGFLSQNATLFVYPALAGLLGGGGEIRRESKIAAALLLAFLLGAYTEVGIFGVMLTGALVLVARQPWRRRSTDLAWIFSGALLLNPGYLGRLVVFLFVQWQETRNPATLAALFPEGGTWLGWGRLFLDVAHPAVVVAAGLGVIALGAWGAWARPSRRLVMALTLGVVILPLLLLRASPGFSIYAFAKLTIQFVPVWVGAAMIGLAHLRRPARRTAWALAAVAAVGTGVMLHWRRGRSNSGSSTRKGDCRCCRRTICCRSAGRRRRILRAPTWSPVQTRLLPRGNGCATLAAARRWSLIVGTWVTKSCRPNHTPSAAGPVPPTSCGGLTSSGPARSLRMSRRRPGWCATPGKPAPQMAAGIMSPVRL